MAHSLVLQFLRTQQCDDIDTVAEYVSSIIDEHGPENVDVEELEDTLMGFLPAWAEKEAESRRSDVSSLLRTVQSNKVVDHAISFFLHISSLTARTDLVGAWFVSCCRHLPPRPPPPSSG